MRGYIAVHLASRHISCEPRVGNIVQLIFTAVYNKSTIMNKLAVVLVLTALAHTSYADNSQDSNASYNSDASSAKVLDIILAGRVPLVDADEGTVAAGPPVHATDRIVGGQETTIEEHPYQVSFIVDGKYFCGGFIVSDEYIISAGHCTQGVDPSKVVLRAGSTYRSNGTVIPIAEVKAHPQYDHPQFDKDVGVMKTKDKIQFNDKIQPIPLADLGRRMVGGSKIVVSGWGRTQFGASTIPERLMDVQIPVVNHMQCRLVYPSILTDNEFCAGNFFLGGQGTCQGDSGGAAIQDGMAVGIVSFGRGCGQPLSPSVFADIASKPIREFIREQTGL